MKKYILIVLLTIIALATSCKDAVICTDCNNNDSTKQHKEFYGKVWYLDSCLTDTVYAIPAFKISIDVKKTYRLGDDKRFDTLITYLESWGYNGLSELNKSEIMVTNKGKDFIIKRNSRDYTYRILDFTNISLTLGVSTDGGMTFKKEAVYRSYNSPKDSKYNTLSISGEIYNPSQLDLNKSLFVYLVFPIKKGNSQEIVYNFMEGQITNDGIYGKRFKFDIVQNLPNQAFMEYSTGGKFAYGEIVLTSKSLPLNTDISSYLAMNTIYLGSVESNGVVWKSGVFSDGSNFKWQDCFKDGFSVAWNRQTVNPLEPNAVNKDWIIPNYWAEPYKTINYANNLTLWVSNEYKGITNRWYN